MRVAVLLGVLLGVAPLAAQQLTPRLQTASPAALLGLSPRLGIPIDSLVRVGRGTWIHDIQVGNGDTAAVGRTVRVHYVGQLRDGAIFAATRGEPFAVTLGAGVVIDGWEEGLLGMRVGGRRQLVIPPELGYGANGDGRVPPDALLVFDVTLVEVARR
jgi:hypothetical protein